MSQPVVIALEAADLSEDDRDFLSRWANDLRVSIEDLLKRILLAAIEGGDYIEKRPKQ